MTSGPRRNRPGNSLAWRWRRLRGRSGQVRRRPRRFCVVVCSWPATSSGAYAGRRNCVVSMDRISNLCTNAVKLAARNIAAARWNSNVCDISATCWLRYRSEPRLESLEFALERLGRFPSSRSRRRCVQARARAEFRVLAPRIRAKADRADAPRRPSGWLRSGPDADASRRCGRRERSLPRCHG